MNNQEFRNELHQYIDKTYDKFCQYQADVLDILKEFHFLCEQNKIKYTLAYGSLLGAIRDNGVIPWDYDVDVQVNYNDLNRLLEVLDNKLSQNLYYTFVNNMKDYPTTCLRICKKGHSFMSLHVDVFFLIGCPEDARKRKSFAKKVRFIARLRQNKYNYNYIDKHALSLSSKIKNYVARIPYLIIPECLLRMVENNICTKYKLNPKFLMTWMDSIKTYKAEYYSKYILAECGFFVNENPEEMLEYMYPNYRLYPSIANRLNEFMNYTDIIESRDKYHIIYLKHLEGLSNGKQK